MRFGFSETLREENKINQGVGDILNRMEADPNHDNKEIYQKELEDLRGGIGEFSNNQAKAKFGQYASTIINKANIKVDGTYRNKMVDYTKGQLLEAERNAFEAYKANPVPEQAAAIRAGYISKVQAANDRGFLDDVYLQQRINELTKWDSDRQDNLMQDLLNNDPELAEAALTSGQFKDMKSESKATWLKVIESAKKQREKEQEDMYKASTELKDDSMTEKFFKDELRIDELNAAMEEDEAKGGATRTTLLSMRDKLYTAQKEKLGMILKTNPKAKDFVKLTDQIIDKKIDLIRAREILIDAYGDGIISKEEGGLLNNIKRTLKDIQFNKNTGPMVLGMKKIKEVFNRPNKSTEDLAADLREYLYTVADGQTKPTIAADGIIKRRFEKDHPEYEGWEDNKIKFEPLVGSLKKLGTADDGMPIIERLNAR